MIGLIFGGFLLIIGIQFTFFIKEKNVEKSYWMIKKRDGLSTEQHLKKCKIIGTVYIAMALLLIYMYGVSQMAAS